MSQLCNKSMDNTVKIKVRRKEDELKLEYLEHLNQSLSEANDRNNGSVPQKKYF